MHVYDGKYPTASTAKFVPPDAPVAAYRKMCARLGIERTVVVQPSTYGKTIAARWKQSRRSARMRAASSLSMKA
jgi:hypothetical protein